MARTKQAARRDPRDFVTVRQTLRQQATVRSSSPPKEPEAVGHDACSPPPTNPETTKHSTTTPVAQENPFEEPLVNRSEPHKVTPDHYFSSVSDEEDFIPENTEGIPLYLSPEIKNPKRTEETTKCNSDPLFDVVDKNLALLGISKNAEGICIENTQTEIPDLNITVDPFKFENDPNHVVRNSKEKRGKAGMKRKIGERDDCGEGTSRQKSQRITRSTAKLAATLLQLGTKPRTKPKKTTPGPISRPNTSHQGLSSAEAWVMFQKIKTKIGLVDKGFHPQSISEYPFIRSVVEQQGIGKSCEVPVSYNLTLMREFYAEVAMTNTDQIKIRRKRFRLSAKKINKFYGLNPPKETDLDKMLAAASEDTLMEVAQALGKPDTHWEPHTNFMVRKFKACNLKADANVWVNFLRHSLSPTAHDRCISVERMFLLFCLMQGKSLNFGKIILNSLKQCAENARGKMNFPSLITQLLIQRRVPRYTDDQIIRKTGSKWQIDLRTVSRLRERKERGLPGKEMNAMLTELLEKQKEDFLKTIKKEGKKSREELMKVKTGLIGKFKKRAKKMRAQIKELKAENTALKTKIAEQSNAAAAPQHDTQPTPRE